MSFCHCYYNISGISFRQGSYLRLDTMGGILEYRYQFESLTDTCTAFARWFRIIDYNSLLDFNLIIGRQNLSPSSFQTQILAHKNTTSWVAACGDVDDWIKILFTSCAKSCQQMDVSEFDKIGSVSAREKSLMLFLLLQKYRKAFWSIECVYCLGQLSAGKMMSVTETKVVCWSSTGQIEIIFRHFFLRVGT